MPARHRDHACSTRRRLETSSSERGFMMVELMVGLVLLAIGVLATAQLFPVGSRSQMRNQMLSTGNYYAQDKLEELRSLPWADGALTVGRHPAGIATEALGDGGAWQRYYAVTQLAAPMDNLKQVSVVVRWSTTRTDSVLATTYVRH